MAANPARPPPPRRLIDRIIRAKTNIIICTRAKPVMQAGFGNGAKNARPTKTRREDVPWDPATDRDLMFEMTTMVILDPKAPGCPVHQIKVADQFKGLLDPSRPMGTDTGREMARWAVGQDDAQKRKDAMDTARTEARKGREALNVYWNSPAGKDARIFNRPIMDELKATAAEADKRASRNEDDLWDGDGEDETARPLTLADIRAAKVAGQSAATILDFYGAQLDRLAATAPDDHAALMAEIEAAA